MTNCYRRSCEFAVNRRALDFAESMPDDFAVRGRRHRRFVAEDDDAAILTMQ
jgi:hypothetical protein